MSATACVFGCSQASLRLGGEAPRPMGLQVLPDSPDPGVASLAVPTAGMTQGMNNFVLCQDLAVSCRDTSVVVHT